MSTGIDHELKAAFEMASDFVQPDPELAAHVRAGARQRALIITIAAAAGSVALLIAIGVGYVAFGVHRAVPATHHLRDKAPRTLINGGSQVGQMAASGRYLYVLSENGDTLAAYDRSSGKLIRQVTAPSEPSALAVGPGGLVWLAFYPNQAGGPTAIWLLSPDLRMHSTAAGVQTSVIVPTGRTTALVPTQYGILTVSMPGPGEPGRATERLQPRTSLGPAHNTAPGVWAGLVNGRFIAQVTNGWGINSHLVIAGQPGITFGGGRSTQVIPGTIMGNSIWVAIDPRPSGSTPVTYGPVVRVNDRLRPDTPPSIKASSILAQTSSLWSGGSTVWAATELGGHALVCFAAGSRIGPVTTLMRSGSVTAVTSIGGIVYVGLQTGDTGQVGTVIRYHIPAACR